MMPTSAKEQWLSNTPRSCSRKKDWNTFNSWLKRTLRKDRNMSSKIKWCMNYLHCSNSIINPSHSKQLTRVSLKVEIHMCPTHSSISSQGCNHLIDTLSKRKYPNHSNSISMAQRWIKLCGSAPHLPKHSKLHRNRQSCSNQQLIQIPSFQLFISGPDKTPVSY